MEFKETLIKIIEYLAVFEEENQHLEGYDLQDFLSFMQSQINEKEDKTPNRHIGGKKRRKDFNFSENAEIILSRQISLLYRYAKEYIKKALENSNLQTVEEFSYLVVLMTFDHLSKTELILKNVMSITSGAEVIKRLLRKGLIKQIIDKNDKRSQLVSITSTGLDEMKKVFPKMQLASEIIRGNLSHQEEQTLVFLLKKLEAYHNRLFLNHRDQDLEQLFEVRKEN